ncbi:DUF1304 domain-containing protein [Polaribacter litorisediminis]|uniref:DUF1304 domain-containing protein n=1 Tax=Polaribacter litorisediminis TaxID=1908341 RepID=UPI001CBD1C58|nr:DUF1304 domain-containing protein [Polaribacter litorisediminis]UAM96985.1 DUF1304 domain-containing protein [Polaribacter litorisediminis]
MNYLQIILITLVSMIHIYIVYLETALWTTQKGMKIFGIKDKQFAEQTKVMAANQGLYNGFLAAGLIWSLFSTKIDVALFFLICVSIAGAFGAYSTKKIIILYIQTLPATIGILSIILF